MTEFTPEWIAEQKEILNKSITKPNQLAGTDDTVVVGVYGYDEEVGYYDYNKFADCGNKSDAEFIYHSCLNYPNALDHIERLQARVQELEQERRWIPVSESKPKSGVPVLVWNGGLHTAFWFEQQDDTPFGGHWVWHPVRKNIYTFMLGVTHWQPLPQPPKDGE